MRNKIRIYGVVALSWLLLMAIGFQYPKIYAGIAGCTSGTATAGGTTVPATGSLDSLAQIQQNRYFSSRLYGLMTFEYPGVTAPFPTEMKIDSLPIEWMGQVFNGEVKNAGRGFDVTEQVHGGVSPDGTWLLTLTYSRKIIRSNNTGIYSLVELRNIPIVTMIDGAAINLGNFQREGDVQKFVKEITYYDGPVENGQIVPVTKYISTDWKNASTGLKPILNIGFSPVSEQADVVPSGGTPSGGMGGGMGR